ncbi:hypothetical protein GIS00_18580 [Nakamurella sp. YIM 132087]|uniref:UGSC-like domain-containing protein n=1 Tax=Nakamurella alba TaxID=2665158 RepID=A0A7K1FP64_9ACTN|nr:hypothetical protein [Nakamurella alba]MTD15945.1 hypothetical protein [Nakamurella alba]
MITTLDPTYRPATTLSDSRTSVAPRPPSLSGRTVGILMNRLANCEVFFDALADRIRELTDVADVFMVWKDSQSVPPTPEQWDALMGRADVVVTGFGGCGSCSTRSMRDALDVEDRGVPAVCIVHEALVPAVSVIRTMAGLPDYRMVVVGYPHGPLAPWTADEALTTAKEVAPQVIDALVAAR